MVFRDKLDKALGKRGSSAAPPPAPVSIEEQLRAENYLRGDTYRLTLYRYRPRPYSGPMALMVNRGWLNRKPALGWKPYALGGIEVKVVAGDHLRYLRARGDDRNGLTANPGPRQRT